MFPDNIVSLNNYKHKKERNRQIQPAKKGEVAERGRLQKADIPPRLTELKPEHPAQWIR
jgi:hypothetical protein